MAECFVGVGANLGNPHAALLEAAAQLAELPGTRLEALSRIYRSEPLGPPGQPDYLNAVVALDTRLGPAELLAALQAIETRAGRERGVRWGPRTLDLDLLIYGQTRIDTPVLQVPHPRIAERNFVLAPLIDVAGEHYRLGDRSLAALLRAAPATRLSATGLAWDDPVAARR